MRRLHRRLGADTTKNFCWGGSTAIRRSTFEQLNVSDRWRGTVSDDFTITRVLKEANFPIHFTPNCLVASVGDCDWRELFEFTTRQIKITRVYASHLWLPLLLGSALFTSRVLRRPHSDRRLSAFTCGLYFFVNHLHARRCQIFHPLPCGFQCSPNITPRSPGPHPPLAVRVFALSLQRYRRGFLAAHRVARDYL